MPGGATLTRPTEFVASRRPGKRSAAGQQVTQNKRAICMSKSVQSNSAVLVHFTLKLDDGSTAESTRNNGKPALFRLGDTSLSEGLEQRSWPERGEKKPFRWSQMLRLVCQARI